MLDYFLCILIDLYVQTLYNLYDDH